MTEALVTPSVLTWARQRRNLDIEALAAKVAVKAEVAAAWESGDQRPTFRQAVKIAKVLRAPLGYFYLPEPPALDCPLPDFRTPPGQPADAPSADLLDLIVDVVGKQEWYREFLTADGVEDLPFVGRYSPADSPEAVARDIKETLAVSKAQNDASNPEEFVRILSANAESAGIIVMRSGVVRNDNTRKLDVAEFRGFSLNDPVAPVIFVNAQDAKNAQVFTIIHEAAHIWTGEGGISGPFADVFSADARNDRERFCDAVAAETLVPSEDFHGRWTTLGGEITARVHNLARRYRVSSLVVLRKAYDLNLMESAEYWHLHAQIRSEAAAHTSKGETGGNFQYTLLARTGAQLTQAVISSASRGDLLVRDAADMLGVSVKTLSSIAEHNFGSSLGLA